MTDKNVYSTKVIASRHEHLKPIPHSATNVTIERGCGGVDPLPAQVYHGKREDRGDVLTVTQTAWVIPKKVVKSFLREPKVLSILVFTDRQGNVVEMSACFPKVELASH